MVACGHSRRANCFGKRLGQQAAAELGAPFAELFPVGPVLVIDDLATSGWHMEEAPSLVRAPGWRGFLTALTHSVECKGRVLPEHNKGTVVHAYRDGQHYEVEFSGPFPCTVTVRRDDIRPA